MKHFSEADVNQSLSMQVAVEAMKEAFHNLAMGRADNVPRRRCRAQGIVLHSMSAAADYLGLAGWKQYTTTAKGARFHVGLYNRDGELIAWIDADRLGQMRTGATTGLAVKYLSDESLDEFGMIGAGWQAESQLEALATVRPIRRVVVFSRDAARREDFAGRMSERYDVQVEAAESAEEAVRDQSVVVTATSSRTPVVTSESLADDVLICAMGSNWLQKAELDVSTVVSAHSVVCDSIECCRLEAGDFSAALEQGKFRWDQATELADVVAGRKKVTKTGRVIFKSVGMALEDVALASRLLDHESGS